MRSKEFCKYETSRVNLYETKGGWIKNERTIMYA